MNPDPYNQNAYGQPQYQPQYPPHDGGVPYPPPNAYGQQPGASSYGGNTGGPMPFVPPMVPRAPILKDDEQGGGGGEWGNFSGLESKEIRRVFIRKVYVILMLQLVVTFGFIALCHFTPGIKVYVKSRQGQWLYWASYVVFLITYLALACCKSVGRKYPLNLILLSLLTLAMSYMMGMISAFYNINSVLIAVGITAFVCLGVTLFSFQTRYDFTSCAGVLLVISLALMAFGFVAIFTYSKIVYTIYAGLGAVAFSIFLAVDTQLIMGGKRQEISAEDHIFASIMLYLDIVYIFMYILMLLGKRE